MIDLEDLYHIAEAMDQQMLQLNVKHKEDFRDRLLISFEIPRLDFLSIDETLYEKEHNTLVGYEKGDSIEVTVLGINFKLTEKETE